MNFLLPEQHIYCVTLCYLSTAYPWLPSYLGNTFTVLLFATWVPHTHGCPATWATHLLYSLLPGHHIPMAALLPGQHIYCVTLCYLDTVYPWLPCYLGNTFTVFLFA